MLRLDVAEHILELREHGVQHGDLAERNIVVNQEGRPFIIEFEHATAHTCKRTMNVDEGVVCPDKLDFGCCEIYDFYFENGIWHPGL